MLRDAAEERVDEEANYWLGEFCRLGMVLSKAEILSRRSGCDRHQVKQALEYGCDPELAFEIFS